MTTINEAAAPPDAVLTLVDGDGREWLCGAVLGNLERYEDGHIAERRSVHDMLDGALAVRRFTVVRRD